MGRIVLLSAMMVLAVRGAWAEGVARLRRNHVGGYSTSGRICLSDCWDQCFTMMTSLGAMQLEPCLKEDFLQYFTAQWFSDQALCAGPCGQFGTSFDFCFINRTTWDYCSSVTRTEFVPEALTNKGEHCAGPCRLNATGVQLCKTASGVDALCMYSSRHYIQAYTSQRRPCVGPCERAGSGTAFYCLDAAVGRRELCALPARVYVHVGEGNAGYGSHHDKTVETVTDVTKVPDVTDDIFGSESTTESYRSFEEEKEDRSIEEIGKMIREIKGSIADIVLDLEF